MPSTPKAPPSSANEHPFQQQDRPTERVIDSIVNTLPIATPIRRIAALVYDLFLLAAISIAYATIFFLIQVFTEGSAATQVLTEGNETTRLEYEGPLRYIFLAGWWLCLALFYSWCWRRSGQTLGMKTWHMRLEQANESLRGKSSLPSWQQCWVRCLLAPPALLCFGLSYGYCFFNREGHCLHDIWSQTRVVVLPKEKSHKQRQRDAANDQNKN